MARHGRLGAGGAHAGRARLRPDRAGVLLDLAGRRQRPADRQATSRRSGMRATSRPSPRMDILISCQGSDYTTEIYPKLRAAGWNGYWIDAARTLRMNDDAVIVLDPVNMPVIQSALAQGHQELHRRQLHGELHADGHARALRARSRRVDDLHDLPGGLGRRRAAHARAADAVRAHQRRGEGAARRSRRRRSSRSTARCSPSRPTARCRWRISAACRSPAT